MNWKRWAKNMLGGAQQAGVTKFHDPPTSVPVTPEPNYTCANCGMLIKSCHGHTREECVTYANDPTTPDRRLIRIMKEGTMPERGAPNIQLPRYQSSASKAKNND